MCVRLIILGLKSSRYVTSAFFLSNSIWSRICLSPVITKGASGLPLPWTRARTLRASSQRSLGPSQRGDSGKKIMPKKRIIAGIIWRPHGIRKALEPLKNEHPYYGIVSVQRFELLGMGGLTEM